MMSTEEQKLRAEIESMYSYIQRLENHIQILESHSAFSGDYFSEINHLHVTIDEKDRELSDLKKKLNTASQRAIFLEKSLNDSVKKCDELERLVNPYNLTMSKNIFRTIIISIVVLIVAGSFLKILIDHYNWTSDLVLFFYSICGVYFMLLYGFGIQSEDSFILSESVITILAIIFSTLLLLFAMDNKSSSITTSSSYTESEEGMVWVDSTSKRYHKRDGCNMDNPYLVTLDEAISMGRTPCGNCYR